MTQLRCFVKTKPTARRSACDPPSKTTGKPYLALMWVKLRMRRQNVYPRQRIFRRGVKHSRMNLEFSNPISIRIIDLQLLTLIEGAILILSCECRGRIAGV